MNTPFIADHRRSIAEKYSEIDIMLATYPRKWTKNEHKELFDKFVSNVNSTSLMRTMNQCKVNNRDSSNTRDIDDNVRFNKLAVRLQYRLYENKYNKMK